MTSPSDVPSESPAGRAPSAIADPVRAEPDAPVGGASALSAPELTRTVLAIIVLVGLLAGTFWVLQPFIPALIWATTIVIATWPLMLGAQRLLWGRRSLAVAVMTVALLLLFFVPLALAIATILENVDTVGGWIKVASTWRFGEPPGWLATLPVVGSRAVTYWRELVASGVEPLIAKIAPYAGMFAGRVLREAGAIGAIALQFLMTVALCAILYATGESAGSKVLRFFRRLAGQRGENTALLAAASIRGVALGVVVTAVVQSMLGALGLAVVGVPAVAPLTAVMFLLAIAQVGVIPVLLPAVIWLFWSGDTVWGVVLAIWMVFVGTIDNFLRPWLIQKGADLPLLLIFAGVVGGLVAFGLVGIFIGPVVLAVTWTLLGAWMEERPAAHRRR
ncbi:MAG: AI-2E family transporter YdiK [Burkholderiales bacterium]|jgi:predicted PurR-regulated permease PerM